MTLDDPFPKTMVRGNAVVVTDRAGSPILRCFDATPLKAIRKLKAFVEARLKEMAEA